jgi:hypothetical protein
VRGAFTAALLSAFVAHAEMKLASPGLTYTNIDPSLGDAIIDRFVTQLGEAGPFKITTAKDIAQVVGLERQKQLMGCSDATSSSCLAELAGALGVDAIISGSLAKIGTGYTITLRVVKSSDGSQLATASMRVKSEDELQDWLESEAKVLAAQIRGGPASTGPAAVTSSSSPSRAGRLLPLIPAIAGVGLAIGGMVLFTMAKADANTLKNDPMPDMINDLAASGTGKQTSGFALMVAGGVAILAGVVWFLLSRSG